MANDHSLPSQNDNRGPSASLASPGTPRKNANECNVLIRSLERQWQLGLTIRDENWSPHKSTDQLSDKVYAQLKRYYWKDQFWQAVGRFSLHAKQPADADTHAARFAGLTLLHETIKEIDRDAGQVGFETGTPTGSRRDFSAGMRLLRTENSCKFENFLCPYCIITL